MEQAKHHQRVRKELLEAGMSHVGIMRSEARFLPSIIYDDEHVGAAVYGIGPDGWCLIVATEKRVIYLDKKPFFITKDILTYDIVSGVQSNTVGPFAAVTLQTRNGNYSVKFVSQNAASKFMKYIEEKRLSGGQYDQRSGRYYKELNNDYAIMDIPNRQATDFIQSNDIGVLSTFDDKQETVSGAVVHYFLDDDGCIYILTKSASRKARSIMSNGKASLTVYQSGSMKTAQIHARATVEPKREKQEQVFHHMIQERSYTEGDYRPPVTSLKEGTYMVIRLMPTAVIYTDYSQEK